MSAIEPIKRLFTYLLSNKYLERHFVHLGILEIFRSTPLKNDISKNYQEHLTNIAFLEPPMLLESFQSNINGLTEQEADELRNAVGLNKLACDLQSTPWRQLWECYRNPFNLLLSVLAVISYFTDDIPGMIVIVSMIILT